MKPEPAKRVTLMITRRNFISKASATTGGIALLLLDKTHSLSDPLRLEALTPNPTYVVTEPCVGCKYTECAAVCPVEAFH